MSILSPLSRTLLILSLVCGLLSCDEREEQPPEWSEWDKKANGITPGAWELRLSPGPVLSDAPFRWVFLYPPAGAEDEIDRHPLAGPEKGLPDETGVQRHFRIRREGSDEETYLTTRPEGDFELLGAWVVIPIEVPGNPNRCEVVVIDLVGRQVARDSVPGTCEALHLQPDERTKYVFAKDRRLSWIRIGFGRELGIETGDSNIERGDEESVHRQVHGDLLLSVVRQDHDTFEVRVVDTRTQRLRFSALLNADEFEDSGEFVKSHLAGDVKCLARLYGGNTRVNCLSLGDLRGAQPVDWLNSTDHVQSGRFVHAQHHDIGGRTLLILVSVDRNRTWIEAVEPGGAEIWARSFRGVYREARTTTTGDRKVFAFQVTRAPQVGESVDFVALELASGLLKGEGSYPGRLVTGSVSLDETARSASIEVSHDGRVTRETISLD